MKIALVLGQLHDRIRHELAGPVVRDVAAALDLEHRDVAGVEHVGLRLLRAAQRDHVIVLDEDQRVVDPIGLPFRDQLELPRARVLVGQAPEVDHAEG